MHHTEIVQTLLAIYEMPWRSSIGHLAQVHQEGTIRPEQGRFSCGNDTLFAAGIIQDNAWWFMASSSSLLIQVSQTTVHGYVLTDCGSGPINTCPPWVKETLDAPILRDDVTVLPAS